MCQNSLNQTFSRLAIDVFATNSHDRDNIVTNCPYGVGLI